jgi:ABC-type ATPase involved in cell division
MPLFKLINLSEGEAAERTETLLTFTGLSGWGPIVAGDLSLEEQYRVALARALAHQPDVLLVEDLDGRLTGDALRRISLLLHEAADRFELTVIAGGSAALIPHGAERVLDLAGGRLIADSASPARVPLEQ